MEIIIGVLMVLLIGLTGYSYKLDKKRRYLEYDNETLQESRDFYIKKYYEKLEEDIVESRIDQIIEESERKVENEQQSQKSN